MSADEVSRLTDLIGAGRLSESRVRLAALLGQPAAQAVMSPGTVPVTRNSLAHDVASCDEGTVVRALLTLARHFPVPAAFKSAHADLVLIGERLVSGSLFPSDDPVNMVNGACRELMSLSGVVLKINNILLHHPPPRGMEASVRGALSAILGHGVELEDVRRILCTELGSWLLTPS
jgi:hypothetical protein